MLLNIRLKITDFFRKHKVKIIIAIVIWLLIVIVNYILAFTKKPFTPVSSYDIHSPILDTEEKVPEKLKQPIEMILNQYYEYCNKKEYEKAYNMLSDEYKNNRGITLEVFKKYIDSVFTTNKVHVIQNYSNLKGIYIYSVKIMDDIMATGLTGVDHIEYVEEKVVIKSEKDGFKVSIGSYVGTEKIDKVYENEHLKLNVISKTILYDKETYTISVVNRTDYSIVLLNHVSSDEIVLDLGSAQREYKASVEPIVIEPGTDLVFTLTFDKFVDDRKNSKKIKV